MYQSFPHHARCAARRRRGWSGRRLADARLGGSRGGGLASQTSKPMAVLGGASASHYLARRLAGGGLRALEGSQPPPLARQGCRNQIEAAATSLPGAEKGPGAPGRRKKCSPGAEKPSSAPETRKVDSMCGHLFWQMASISRVRPGMRDWEFKISRNVLETRTPREKKA